VSPVEERRLFVLEKLAKQATGQNRIKNAKKFSTSVRNPAQECDENIFSNSRYNLVTARFFFECWCGLNHRKPQCNRLSQGDSERELMDTDYVSLLFVSVLSLSLFCNGMLQRVQIPFAHAEKWLNGR
jgi:hypothetical protein